MGKKEKHTHTTLRTKVVASNFWLRFFLFFSFLFLNGDTGAKGEGFGSRERERKRERGGGLDEGFTDLMIFSQYGIDCMLCCLFML